MLIYYDKLLQYLKEENFEDALKYFEKWKIRGLLSEEEIENLSKILPEWSKMVSAEALSRLLVKKRAFTQGEFLEMTEAVDQEMRVKTKWKSINELWIKA
jgi:hypothetical protein